MKTSPLTALAVGAAVVTVALTGTAFWLSYEHLAEVAEHNGLSGRRAWAWPATVDLFIMAGELLWLRASLLRRGVDWWAVALTASGSLGSIALNVAGVGTDARALEYVVAAVPPVAALLAFGALMRQVHERLAEHVEQAPADKDVHSVAAPRPGRPQDAPEGVRLLPIVPRPAPETPTVTLDRQDAPDALEDADRTPELEASGRVLVPSSEASARLGISPSTLRNWVHDGRLSPADKDAAGRNLFDVKQLEAMAS